MLRIGQVVYMFAPISAMTLSDGLDPVPPVRRLLSGLQVLADRQRSTVGKGIGIGSGSQMESGAIVRHHQIGDHGAFEGESKLSHRQQAAQTTRKAATKIVSASELRTSLTGAAIGCRTATDLRCVDRRGLRVGGRQIDGLQP